MVLLGLDDGAGWDGQTEKMAKENVYSVTGCGAITSNTINASRPYSPCTAYAGTSTTEVRFRTSLSAGSYLTELMFYYMKHAEVARSTCSLLRGRHWIGSTLG